MLLVGPTAPLWSAPRTWSAMRQCCGLPTWTMSPVYLFAALVPPREAVDDLWQVVDAVTTSLTADDRAPGRHAWRSPKPSRRERRALKDAGPVGPPLVLEPAAQVHVPLAKFGNLTLTDAERLATSMATQASEWAAPRLRLSGHADREQEEDPSVWVELTGDPDGLDDLGTVARGVPRVAQGLRLFVDRRQFQPRVRLGQITEHATPPYVQALLDTLDQFDGRTWTQSEVLLLTHADHGPDQPSFKTFATVPLGARAAL